MRLITLFVALALFAWPGTPAYASPAEATAPAPPGRADLLAERLAKDPIQVTDHALRELAPDTATRIRTLVARLGVPVYVVVEPDRLPLEADSRALIPLLHDRMRKNGIYVVTNPDGYGDAEQFGGSLPADRAWTVASLEMPYDAGLVEHVQRFVEILTAPNPAERIKERRPKPEDDTPSARDLADRKEMTAFGIGTAAGGIPLLALLLVIRHRRGARR